MTGEAWPLRGLRVLDCTSEIAGPYATKLLVDAGADVIKVERPAGDPLRRWTASRAPIAEGEDGPLFRFLNGGKRSVVVDREAPEGLVRLAGLAAEADLLFESFGPGGLVAHGLDLGALQRGNPVLSVVSISPWGVTGPWAERPATEWTLQAACGATAHRGLPARGPVGAGGRIGDWAAAPYAALGGLFAWLSARKTGRGQHVDVSSFEAVVSCMAVYHDLQSQFHGGVLPQLLESPSIEPARDGWIGLTTYTGQQWKDLCLLMGRPELGDDERYYDATARMNDLEFIHEALHAWTREKTVDELIELASLVRIPVAPVGDGRRVLEFDHFRERGVYAESPHGGFVQPRVPYRLEKTPVRPFERAPALGAHPDARFDGERRPAGEGGSALPLDRIRVIDLTAFWAGPVSTSMLADMGADVIKVESIQRPDGMRFAGAVRNEVMWEWAHVFHGANPGKRGITLRLDSDEGRELLLRLVEGADVLAENFSVRVMGQLGLSWEALRERNPRLVMLRMPAWGLDGPWRDRVGFAPSVEQASGLAWITGYEDLPLILRGACDPIGGMHAVFALMLALEHRRRTGEGQLVEVPLVEPALNIAAEQVIEYSAYGRVLTRSGNRGPAAAPQGVYRCAAPRDEREAEWLALAVANDPQWEGLRRVFGDPEWARDPALATADGRRGAHDAIDAHLSEWCASRSCSEAEAELLAAGVPVAQCINGYHLVPNPQLTQRGFHETLEHPVTGKTRYQGIPMAFGALPRPLHRSPPPTLGQHNDEILRAELGLSSEEIEGLRERQIIGERPSFM
jgi:crotonobetainyl-CoA:carnitine CoA-transferase CaiB-like acyl-CoA transferase